MATSADHAYGPDPEPEITPGNALVVIAQELRGIKRTLWQMAFDPNLETLQDRMASSLHDNLQTFEGDHGGETVAELLKRIATALEDR